MFAILGRLFCVYTTKSGLFIVARLCFFSYHALVRGGRTNSDAHRCLPKTLESKQVGRSNDWSVFLKRLFCSFHDYLCNFHYRFSNGTKKMISPRPNDTTTSTDDKVCYVKVRRRVKFIYSLIVL